MTMLLTLPRLGETMESGRVVGWLKQPGETFRRGETIVEIEFGQDRRGAAGTRGRPAAGGACR